VCSPKLSKHPKIVDALFLLHVLGAGNDLKCFSIWSAELVRLWDAPRACNYFLINKVPLGRGSDHNACSLPPAPPPEAPAAANLLPRRRIDGRSSSGGSSSLTENRRVRLRPALLPSHPGASVNTFTLVPYNIEYQGRAGRAPRKCLPVSGRQAREETDAGRRS